MIRRRRRRGGTPHHTRPEASDPPRAIGPQATAFNKYFKEIESKGKAVRVDSVSRAHLVATLVLVLCDTNEAGHVEAGAKLAICPSSTPPSCSYMYRNFNQCLDASGNEIVAPEMRTLPPT